MKRPREEAVNANRSVKRKRFDAFHQDRLASLSHELTLRILSYLSVSELAKCHRISQHFRDLAGDSQLWKSHFYNRFVRPRASRIPGLKGSEDSTQALLFSSKISRWLDDESLVKRGRETNWKRQYKLRHNWSQGTCSVSEVAVSQEASVPPLLVQMYDSTIFMADSADGLRAWKSTGARDLFVRLAWADLPGHDVRTPPTSLAVDNSRLSPQFTLVSIGFQDGSFSILKMDHLAQKFKLLYRHEASSNGMLSAIALSYPYLATMTANQLLSVYTFSKANNDNQFPDSAISLPITLSPPSLVHSLHSRTVWPPLTLSIRPSPALILISIAYALPTYLSGWTVGLQELHLDPKTSTTLLCRLASAIPSSSPPLFQPTSTFSRLTPWTENTATAIHSVPTSLSYTHPYLLSSHPDNTLTLYLVSSTKDSLSISSPRRLWGHTSSVSGTSIGSRGKAVSVSKRGDEIRVWDLEQKAGKVKIENAREGSVRVSPNKTPGMETETRDLGVKMNCGLESMGEDELSIARGWVGFDEENVVLLKERQGRGQSLVVYDFA